MSAALHPDPQLTIATKPAPGIGPLCSCAFADDMTSGSK
jgi:hypothetical protein